MLHKATIVGFSGDNDSEFAYIRLKDNDTGQVQSITCYKSPTVRALNECWPGVITQNNFVNVKAMLDHSIFWRLDDMGYLLSGFVPVEQASGEVWEQYRCKVDLVR